MVREPLLAGAGRPGRTRLLFLAVSVVACAAAAQSPSEIGNNVVPVPGATPHAARLRGPVPCDQVIARLDHNLRIETGRQAKVPGDKERADSIDHVARRLGTTQLWVTQCMRAYGRRLPAALDNVQDPEDLIEDLEAEEPEESAPEDLEEPGARARNPLVDDNRQDRQEIGPENRQEKAQAPPGSSKDTSGQ
jgi:hypothetical protein